MSRAKSPIFTFDYKLKLRILASLYNQSKTPKELAEALGTSLMEVKSAVDELLGEQWVKCEIEDNWYEKKETPSENKLKLTEDGQIRASTISDLSVFDWHETDLEELQSADLLGKLIQLLGEGLPRAAYVLGEIGDSRTVPALIDALASRKKVV